MSHVSAADLQQGQEPHSTAPQSISLSFFIAKHFTVFEAGFALKTHGSLVNGLMPLRAFVAGLFFSFMFSIPPSLKAPDFFTCSTATPMNASTTPFTSFVFNPVVSATDWNTPVCVIAPPAFIAALRAFMAFFMAFMAFMAFIAFIAAMLRGWGFVRELYG